jgi:hypothetical protein
MALEPSHLQEAVTHRLPDKGKTFSPLQGLWAGVTAFAAGDMISSTGCHKSLFGRRPSGMLEVGGVTCTKVAVSPFDVASNVICVHPKAV